MIMACSCIILSKSCRVSSSALWPASSVTSTMVVGYTVSVNQFICKNSLIRTQKVPPSGKPWADKGVAAFPLLQSRINCLDQLRLPDYYKIFITVAVEQGFVLGLGQIKSCVIVGPDTCIMPVYQMLADTCPQNLISMLYSAFSCS